MLTTQTVLLKLCFTANLVIKTVLEREKNYLNYGSNCMSHNVSRIVMDFV